MRIMIIITAGACALGCFLGFMELAEQGHPILAILAYLAMIVFMSIAAAEMMLAATEIEQ